MAKIISYERRVYESVDDNTLYLTGYILKTDEKKNAYNKGLTMLE